MGNGDARAAQSVAAVSQADARRIRGDRSLAGRGALRTDISGKAGSPLGSSEHRGGWARQGGRELCRYLSISRGSLAELGYTLRLAHDRGLLSEAEWRDLNDLRGAAEAITWRLYKAVKAKCARIA